MEEKILKKKSKIICNIAYTKYEIIKHVSEKVFFWGISLTEDDEEWDILWTDNAVTPDKLAKMKLYQKINHFPGMYSISRKNYLAYNLNKLKKIYPEEYNFFPKTWVIPCDMGELKAFIQSKKKCFLIVKPEASCQGRGIYITRKLEEIDTSSKHVVQEYINKPYLIDGLKFDLRIYVLLTGSDPLRIFIHKEGLTRFATENYSKPTINNSQIACMHLTNYAVNKHNPNFIHNKDANIDNFGHKRSLQSTLNYLKDQGADTIRLLTDIEDIIIKTICCIQPNLSHHYKSCQPDDFSNSMCFEILGFDILLDSRLKPYVLEVNHTPSFTTDSPLDFTVKKNVISDTLQLLGLKSSSRTNYIKKLKEDIAKRSATGKIERISKEEREEKINLYKEQRDLWEETHSGGYKKIYPVKGCEKYDAFIKSADEIWQEWTGANINRNKKVEIQSKPKPKITIKKKLKTSNVNNCSHSFDVFSRLSKPISRTFKTDQYIFPSIVYKDNCQRSFEKPVANINYLNLFAKVIVQEEKIIKKNNNTKAYNLPPRIEQPISTKIQEKRIKKATLKEILSLDCLNLKITSLNSDYTKRLENNIFT